MKWNKILFGLLLPAIILAGSGSLVASAAAPVAGDPQFGPGPVVEIGVFRERLAPYGRWFTIPSYGLVWSPFNVVADWGPYVDGSWEYTDAGWTWASDDPWGWATCHYGRWLFDPAFGWAWVPGTEWSPAWVDWVYGDGFIGWAPLSPAFVGIGGFAPIPVRFFRFSRDRDFDRPHIGRFIFPAVRNRELFERAHRVTNFERINGVVVNRSFSREMIERAAGHPIQERAFTGPRIDQRAPRFREDQTNRQIQRQAQTDRGQRQMQQEQLQRRQADREQMNRQDRPERQQMPMRQIQPQMAPQPRMQVPRAAPVMPPRQMSAPRQPQMQPQRQPQQRMMSQPRSGGGNGGFRRR